MDRDLLLMLKELTLRQIVVQVADVLIVAYIIYRLLLMVRGTRAWRILFGIVVFALFLWLSDVFKLTTLHWLPDKATLLGPVALAILFLPELRQAIEGLTKFSLLPQTLVTGTSGVNLDGREIEEIVAAVGEMSEDRIGALLVIEKDGRLEEIASSGIPLGALVSKSLLLTIFYGENPLHDGAALIRGRRSSPPRAASPSPRAPVSTALSTCAIGPLSESRSRAMRSQSSSQRSAEPSP